MPERGLLALADEAVTDGVVEFCGGLVVDGGADVNVLVFLRGEVGDVVKAPGVGDAGGTDVIVRDAADLGAGIGLPAEIGDRGAEVELVIGQGVAGLEPTVGAKIVKLAACAGQLKALLRGVEIAGAALKEQGGKAGGAAGSGDADDAGHGPGAIKVGVRTAVDFDGIDSGGGEGAEVKLVAEIPNVDAVEEDHIVVGVSAADEERGLSPRWPVWARKAPGMRRRELTRLVRRARSSGPRTVVAELVCGWGVGVPVA